jgi:hypothetical protein
MESTVRKDNRMQKKLCFRQALAAVAVLATAGSAWAGDHYVSSGLNLPSKLSIGVGFDCKNSPGPTISLGDGKVLLGDVEGQLTFSNNLKFTHVADPGVLVKAAVLLDFGFPVLIPKQPSRPADYYGSDLTGTGVGGNPWIYAELYDAKGNGLKKLDGSALGPILLGRCVQGAAVIDQDFLQAAIATARIHHDDDDNCYNNPGPYIYIEDGIIALSGVKVKVTFTNNAKFTHAAAGDATLEFVVISPNGTVTIPKQPPLGGAGGNPHVWFQFLNGGEPVGTFPGFYLGRCVQDL